MLQRDGNYPATYFEQTERTRRIGFDFGWRGGPVRGPAETVGQSDVESEWLAHLFQNINYRPNLIWAQMPWTNHSSALLNNLRSLEDKVIKSGKRLPFCSVRAAGKWDISREETSRFAQLLNSEMVSSNSSNSFRNCPVVAVNGGKALTALKETTTRTRPASGSRLK